MLRLVYCDHHQADSRNITVYELRKVEARLATAVAVQKQWILHILSVCLYSVRYPACNAHALYCYLWPAPPSIIFPHYHINGTIFGKWKLNVCFVFYSTFVWNISPSKRPLGRPRRRWVDNIRMDLQEVRCGYMDWIGLAQDIDSWRTLVSAVMNLRVPWNAGNFLTSCKPVSFSRRTLYHGVSK